jgi:hypothetical protein
MKLPDALRGVRQLAFDTAPLIYFVEQHALYFERMLFIMRYVDAGLIDGVASTIALAEVLVQPLRAGDKGSISAFVRVRPRPITRSLNSFILSGGYA